MKQGLNVFFRRLFFSFGPQKWWPAQTPFEVIVGAILTQNTSWRNVEKAIANLKCHNLLTPQKLYAVSDKRLALCIRPSGYYNIKAQRLKAFLRFFFEEFGGSLSRMREKPLEELRPKLLSVKGIGPETADSILLYALKKPVFVVDAYTKRVFLRHGFIRIGAEYDEIQGLCMKSLEHNTKMFNEYHALLVKLGKEFCLKAKPKCGHCPLYQKKGVH